MNELTQNEIAVTYVRFQKPRYGKIDMRSRPIKYCALRFYYFTLCSTI